jgi:pyridoxine 5'-phosphate synthase PdxJ
MRPAHTHLRPLLEHAGEAAYLRDILAVIKAAGIRTSIFVDPNERLVRARQKRAPTA